MPVDARIEVKGDTAIASIKIICDCKKLLYNGILDLDKNFEFLCPGCKKKREEEKAKEEERMKKRLAAGCRHCGHEIIMDRGGVLHDGFYTQTRECSNGNVQCKCTDPALRD